MNKGLLIIARWDCEALTIPVEDVRTVTLASGADMLVWFRPGRPGFGLTVDFLKARCREVVLLQDDMLFDCLRPHPVVPRKFMQWVA